MPGRDRVLFRGGTVISMDPAYPDEWVADVLVEGENIVEIAPSITVDAASCEIFPAETKVVLPGLIDTHRHIWQAPLRYCGTDWGLEHYSEVILTRGGPAFTADDHYVAVRLGLAEALDAGITQLFDWNHNINSPEHADAAVRAHTNAKMRIIFGYGQSVLTWREAVTSDDGLSKTMPSEDVRRVQAQYYSSSDSLRTLALAARGPEISTMGVVSAELAQARELGLRVSIHVGNGERGPRFRPIAMMNEAGLLGDDITWVHCNSLADAELRLIAESGGSASVASELEMHMGHGHPAVSRLVANGIRPSLSVDTCANVSGDLFAVMRMTLAAARADWNDRVLADLPVGQRLETRDVLEFATLQGAAANGLARSTGSISVGKKADLLVIGTDRPNLLPLNYATGAVVMGAHPGNVEAVMVNGEFLKRDYALVGIDIEHLRRRANTLRDKLFERMGAHVGRWMPLSHQHAEMES